MNPRTEEEGPATDLKAMEQWGLQIDIASIQEVLPMINLLSDILTVVSIIVYVIQKVLELGPPRLLEVINY